MTDLTGKVALITGAGRGLGRALALAFAAQGAIVAANDLVPTNVDDVVAAILADDGRAKTYLADVAKKVALQAVVTDVLADWERIDILVNAASVQPHQSLLDMDEWDWRRTLDTNLTAAFIATQSTARVMRQLGGGLIVNLGPVDPHDLHSEPRAAYLASKHALLAFTQAAAHELAPDNIRVNAVCPAGHAYDQAVSQVLHLCGPQAADITGQVFSFPSDA